MFLKRIVPKIIYDINKICVKNGVISITLKDGNGEKLIKDKNLETERFFAFWKQEEFLDIVDGYFNVLYPKLDNLYGKNYLELFLRNLK